MALQDAFLTPLGLAALALAVPIIVLYLIRPDPEKRSLPTIRFLIQDQRKETTNPILERLRRNLLLFVQLLVVIVLALALASPYVLVSESQTVEETVLVVDASASMATTSDGASRFARAVAAARDDATGTTSVVVAATEPRVALRDGSRTEVGEALDSVRVTDAPGDLKSAVETASSLAGENAQVLVYSDFADDTAWKDAVRTARARELDVELHQFNGGGAGNVGIIDIAFSGNQVTATVKNFGESRATRTLSLGNQRASLSLDAGDVTSESFTVPGGGGQLALTPGDSFATDDVAYVAAPSDATVDVLLLTNDENRFLATALSVIPQVELTTDAPPTTIDARYDVIIYSNLQDDRLLRTNVGTGRDLLERGGGIAIQAQSNPPMPQKYGDLLLVEPGQTRTNPTIGGVADHELTRDITFPPPEEYVQASLVRGQPLVSTTDGTPLLATDVQGSGRILYYGYIEESSAFKYDFRYPVFWKRAVFYLAGREPLPALNRQTGSRLQFTEARTVETPGGSVTGRTIPLDDAGFYASDDRQFGASLLSEAESNVVVDDLNADTADDGGIPSRVEERQVPQPVTQWVALLALLPILGELAYLRWRGDL